MLDVHAMGGGAYLADEVVVVAPAGVAAQRRAPILRVYVVRVAVQQAHRVPVVPLLFWRAAPVTAGIGTLVTMCNVLNYFIQLINFK